MSTDLISPPRSLALCQSYIVSCLSSIVSKSIQNLEIGCPDPILCGETFLACQATPGDSDLCGRMRLDCLERKIRVSCEEAGNLRQRISRDVVESRKLHLILDLDHTLLHSMKFYKGNPVLNTLAGPYGFLGTTGDTTGDLLIDDIGMKVRVTKLRPFLRSFLKEASAMFELTVYTMGPRVYAHNMVDLIDPDPSYFRNRVIAKEDSTDPNSKSLDIVLAEPSCTLILDDSFIWPDHTRNLILAERFSHFGNNKPREHDGSSYLGNVLNVLKSVHQGYFDMYDRGDRGAADVRSQLTALRGDVLRDCQLLIPSCSDREMRMARELGAVVHSTCCSLVTHVVSGQPDAVNSRWALEQNKFLVHPDWVFSAFQQWRRLPEHEFPPTLASRV